MQIVSALRCRKFALALARFVTTCLSEPRSTSPCRNHPVDPFARFTQNTRPNSFLSLRAILAVTPDRLRSHVDVCDSVRRCALQLVIIEAKPAPTALLRGP
jgi:hypothetical protein